MLGLLCAAGVAQAGLGASPALGQAPIWQQRELLPGVNATDEGAEVTYWVDLSTVPATHYTFVVGHVTNAMGGSAIMVARYKSEDGSDRIVTYYPPDPFTAVGVNKGYGIGVDQTTGDVYVTGEGASPSGDADYITIKMDKTLDREGGAAPWPAVSGDIVGVRRYNQSGGHDRAVDISVPFWNSDDIVVTGTSRNGAGDNDIVTIRYRKETGNFSSHWPDDGLGEGVRREGGSGNDSAAAVATGREVPVDDEDTVVYVAGTIWNGTSRDVLAVRYGLFAEPADSWERQYNGPANGDDVATSLAVLRDISNNVTHVAVGGYTPHFPPRIAGSPPPEPVPPDTDYLVVGYTGDVHGFDLWTDGPARTWDPPAQGPVSADVCHAVAFGSRAVNVIDIWLTGRAYQDPDATGGTDSDAGTVAFTLGSTAPVGYGLIGDPLGDDAGYAIAIGGAGAAYVAGEATLLSGGVETSDALLAKLIFGGATGIMLDSSVMFDHAGKSDSARGLWVSSDPFFVHFGEAYITGKSRAQSTGFDGMTLRYILP